MLDLDQILRLWGPTRLGGVKYSEGRERLEVEHWFFTPRTKKVRYLIVFDTVVSGTYFKVQSAWLPVKSTLMRG